MAMEMQGADPGWPLTDRLRRAREYGGFDQAQLAVELGVSKNTISNYERGFTKPRRPMLLAWAMATGVALTWLETDDASKIEIVRPKGLEPLTFWSGISRWMHKSAHVRRNANRVARFATRITCPRCGRTNDVREGYCGNCHDWTDGLRAEDLALAA